MGPVICSLVVIVGEGRVRWSFKPITRRPLRPEGWLGELNPYLLAGEGFGAPGTQTVVPLSRKVYLVAAGEGTKMRIVQENKDWVDFANETQTARGDNLLIAGDESILRNLDSVPKKAFLNQDRGPQAVTGSFSTG